MFVLNGKNVFPLSLLLNCDRNFHMILIMSVINFMFGNFSQLGQSCKTFRLIGQNDNIIAI